MPRVFQRRPCGECRKLPIMHQLHKKLDAHALRRSLGSVPRRLYRRVRSDFQSARAHSERYVIIKYTVYNVRIIVYNL